MVPSQGLIDRAIGGDSPKTLLSAYTVPKA